MNTILHIETSTGEALFLNHDQSPSELRQTLSPLIVNLRSRLREASSAPPPAADLLDQLQRLAHLHESGALTAEEFTVAKQRLLGM